ncbi:hypothetical protein BG006_006200 [Podila minutissima]|uniref:HMG box domain-containing protein n=1 Tax=Podila minutissima TaxID=64525 RepID=A0A9P5SIZ5_9FUNG|nr:hypothetical protein BG006_006200 [Podila minutissima]
MITPLQAPSIGINSATGDMAYPHATPAFNAPSDTMFSSAAQSPPLFCVQAYQLIRCYYLSRLLPASELKTRPSIHIQPTILVTKQSALHQKRRKDKRQALRAPRPRNCFMLYRSKVLPQIMVELGTINNKIISKIAAERWRAEKEDVKAWYRMMAKRGKEEHARNNPGYKYAPYKKQMMAEMRNNAQCGQATPIACGLQGGDEDIYSTYKVDHRQDFTMSLFNEEDRTSLEPTSFDSQAQTSSSKKLNAATRLLNVLKGKSPLSSSRSPAKRFKSNEPTSSGLSSKLSGLLQPFSNTLLSPCAPSTASNGAHPIAFAAGTGLIEQQLYQKNHQSQQVQSQYPNFNSLYNLADINSSSATLVDPLQNQWLQQRYHDPSILNDYLGLTTQQQQQLAQTFNQMKEPSSYATPLVVSHPYLGFQPSMIPLPLLNKGGYDLGKDLPPLPIGSFNHTGSQALADPAVQDCQSIMAQLYANYNGAFDSSLTPPNAQSEFYLDHNDGMWSKHQQMLPLQQTQPLQQQQPPYLIKPSNPQFLSFADLMQPGDHTQCGQLPQQPQHGQDPLSMSLMGLFSWPPPV